MRAPRYSIGLPFFFRRRGEHTWWEGKTENISRTGVLFQAQELVEQQTPIEMRFTLPVEISGRPAVLVACRGLVARVVPPSTPGALPSLAATISRYRIVRQNPAN